MSIEIGIIGATGKMGRRLIALGRQDPSLHVALGLCSQASLEQGKDLAIPCTTNFDDLAHVHVVIDFSTSSLLPSILEFANNYQKPLVIGTTGHEEKELELLREASRHLPIFKAANFSLGIALLIQSVQSLASTLPNFFSISIEETHHLEKKDMPSGTAISIKSAIPSHIGDIPITSNREGTIIGEHCVTFNAAEERLMLVHSAKSRDLFAKGALCAAKFLIDQPAGLYGMADLLYKGSL